VSSAAYLMGGRHEPKACHGLLVLDLTVVPRGERVSFVHGISFTAKNIAEDATARDELIGKIGRMAVECPNCAGHALRVHEDAGRWSATLAYRVSCPNCDDAMTLPDDVKPGDTIRCCGRTYRLTLEYGAFAAEEA